MKSELCWENDIANQTIPEYIEHHEAIVKIMNLIDEKMEKYREDGKI